MVALQYFWIILIAMLPILYTLKRKLPRSLSCFFFFWFPLSVLLASENDQSIRQYPLHIKEPLNQIPGIWFLETGLILIENSINYDLLQLKQVLEIHHCYNLTYPVIIDICSVYLVCTNTDQK